MAKKKRLRRKRYASMGTGPKKVMVVDTQNGQIEKIDHVRFFKSYNQLSVGELLYLLKTYQRYGEFSELKDLSRMTLRSAIQNLLEVAYSDLCILGEDGIISERQYKKLLVKLLKTLDILTELKNDFELFNL